MGKYGDNIKSNFFNDVSNNFFSSELSIEKAILQRPIILPACSEEYIDYNTLKAYSEIEAPFILADDVYCDIKANFYIPLITPMVEDGESTIMMHDSPKLSNINSVGEMVASEYMEANYVPLVIPKYIVMNFRNEIPKGTEFIINFTGGSLNYANIHIMGIGNIGEESVFPEEYKESHRMLTWGELVGLAGGEEAVPEFLEKRIMEREEMFLSLQEEYYFNDDETGTVPGLGIAGFSGGSEKSSESSTTSNVPKNTTSKNYNVKN